MLTTLPDRHSFTFTYWLFKKGYRPVKKKDGMTFVKSKQEVVRIYADKHKKQDNYPMNQHGRIMFYRYCATHFKHYPSFVERLAIEGSNRIEAARNQYQKQSYLIMGA